MAKDWYPIVDSEKCSSCGKCSEKCSHGVYDKEKSPKAYVVFPEGCVDHCHGCGDLCPSGAITYANDNTGWTPPASIK